MEEPVAKKLCEDTAKEYEKDKNTIQENESCVEFQPELTYDVLRIIFTYLNGKDLSNAAMVCRYLKLKVDLIEINIFIVKYSQLTRQIFFFNRFVNFIYFLSTFVMIDSL